MSEPIFLRIDRDSQVFKDRAFTFTDIKGNILKSIPIPDDLIVCDSCNAKIETDKIYILVSPNGLIDGAYCEECRLKYYPDFAIITQSGDKINGI